MLVSRAEAKRIASRLECLEEVVLDFDGVAAIGQAFADELFRVFAAVHPNIRITPVNTAPAVDQMIRRAVAAGAAQSGPGAHS
ncbi:MAG: STAS-like domain-containing protein [Gammaproteobacteria bacterium]|nr:STAS-like domain-containing protein [Gammaproteobacteria bacterium]